MRRRRIRNNNTPNQNLDSFLDILTNTVGVLMFIGLFVSLLAVEAGTVIRTPLKSNTNKIVQFFEIRNKELFYLSDDKIDEEIAEMLMTLPNCKPPDIPEEIEPYLYDFYLKRTAEYRECQRVRKERTANFSYNNGYYQISFIEGQALQYEPVENAKGENKEQLKQENSQFKIILNKLDPDIYYIAFVVRPDSFSTFRTARQEAWNQGFDVGWEPLSQDSSLIFGSGGRSVGVQ